MKIYDVKVVYTNGQHSIISVIEYNEDGALDRISKMFNLYNVNAYIIEVVDDLDVQAGVVTRTVNID